jgi:hypothetical protein
MQQFTPPQPSKLAARPCALALQLTVHQPNAGAFPEHPSGDDSPVRYLFEAFSSAMPCEIDLASRDEMRKRLCPDPYGLPTWDPEGAACVSVYLVSSSTFEAVTGVPAPKPIVSRDHYDEFGIPWLKDYEEKHASRLGEAGR